MIFGLDWIILLQNETVRGGLPGGVMNVEDVLWGDEKGSSFVCLLRNLLFQIVRKLILGFVNVLAGNSAVCELTGGSHSLSQKSVTWLRLCLAAKDPAACGL